MGSGPAHRSLSLSQDGEKILNYYHLKWRKIILHLKEQYPQNCVRYSATGGCLGPALYDGNSFNIFWASNEVAKFIKVYSQEQKNREH
jgi:hypothetical protein